MGLRLNCRLPAGARAQFPTILATEVPYWSEIERMSVRRAPLPACAPKSDAARIYSTLWHEVHQRLHWLPRAVAGALAVPAAGSEEPTGHVRA